MFTIDSGHPAASWFLWGSGAFFLVVYALPLLFAPLTWARGFLWRIPADNDLTAYLGRSLGAVAVALVTGCFRAAPAPASNRLIFEMIIEAMALLVGVHVYGAVRRAQPWTETAEIALFVLTGGVALWFHHALF